MNENVTDKEAIDSRHRKEKKDLQSRIQQLKKSVNKSDKKRKKEVLEEITRLEQDLEQKQAQELLEFEKCDPCNTEILEVTEALENLSNFKEVPQRVTKAQKRREKKAQQDKDREKEIEAQEKLNVHGDRHIETQKIKEVLKERKLMIYEIPSDGNCLYCAVDHQLSQIGDAPLGLDKLRSLTSKFLLEHCDDYLPFMSHPETGDLLTDEQYRDYCNKVATTSVWGGEVELQALAQVLKRRIEVIQAKGPIITIGEAFPANKKLTLSYHRHMYGLGEHYNSVQPYVEEIPEETS